jgi:hypothetical protein
MAFGGLGKKMRKSFFALQSSALLSRWCPVGFADAGGKQSLALKRQWCPEASKEASRETSEKECPITFI